ncbi:MAG: hypothetical protein LBP96_03785 [Bacteroidales bacterium]|jgi:hypothetical protein|nr:hypothetical protein [Bacteroidales bacterium]
MSDYSQMSVDSLIELKNWVEDCPYCQTAQILYLLNLKRLGEDTFDARLPHTAICINNRQRLKDEVEKIEEILLKECHPESFLRQDKPREGTKSKQILRYAQDDNKKVGSFRSKTISERLNLSKSEPEKTRLREPLPPTPNTDDKLLEQLRLEALAKVNNRLNEVRKSITAPANVTEIPNRMTMAQSLIDKVIATNPKISKVDDSDTKLNKFSHWKFKEEHSLREDFEMVSETLAQLYIAQGAPAKAREIYKTLSKTHPEKAEHFTQLSKQIKTHNRASQQDKQNKITTKKTKK